MIANKKQRIVWVISGFIALLVAATLPIGCGGGDENNGQSAIIASGRSTGTIRLNVAWPAADTRVVPKRTNEIRVTVTSLDGFFDDGKRQRVVTIPRPSPSPLELSLRFPTPTPGFPGFEITGVPTGEVSVEVSAYDVAGERIARSPARTLRVQPASAQFFSAVLNPEPVPTPTLVDVQFSRDTFQFDFSSGVNYLTVRLSGSAPVEGATIALTGNSPELYIPPSVFIPYDQEQVTILLFPGIFSGDPVVREITATYEGISLSDTVTVVPYSFPTPPPSPTPPPPPPFPEPSPTPSDSPSPTPSP